MYRENHSLSRLIIFFMKLKPSSSCIYCGKTGDKLDKEHIIPYGLGGQWVMRSASCKNCATITSQLELLVLRKMYLPLRTKHNFPTRDKRDRPKSFKATIIKADDSRETINVPVSIYPTIYPIILPPQPGILNDNEKRKANFETKIMLAGNEDEMHAFATAYPDAVEFEFSWNLSLDALLRVLAKIAHSYIVACYGIIGYTPLLPSIILGKQDPAYLVGGIAEIVAADKSRERNFGNGLQLLVTKEGHMIVNIDIAGGRFPTYSVVAGKVEDWAVFMTHSSHVEMEDKKEYSHGMRVRWLFAHEWMIDFTRAIRFYVERHFNNLKEQWPLLNGYSFDLYALPPGYYLIILKNSNEVTPSGPNGAIVLPYNDHPALPPIGDDLSAWRKWCQNRIAASCEDWPIILPAHDSGQNPKKDYALFNEEERAFWDVQLQHTIMMQLKQVLSKAQK